MTTARTIAPGLRVTPCGCVWQTDADGLCAVLLAASLGCTARHTGRPGHYPRRAPEGWIPGRQQLGHR